MGRNDIVPDYLGHCLASTKVEGIETLVRVLLYSPASADRVTGYRSCTYVMEFDKERATLNLYVVTFPDQNQSTGFTTQHTLSDPNNMPALEVLWSHWNRYITSS